MDTYEKIQAGKMIALISFIFETTIFVLYFLIPSYEVILVGFALFVLTVFFNIIVLLILIYGAIKDKVNRNKIFLTGGVMFMNIPVILIYGWIALILFDTMILFE
ncbi:MAG: hypothetical protein RO257_04790 [Candidatus Kapabacteria bacterium]|jgi:hypothetical protein|nr:hypothetical protein [Candidatus Kapabacteria bacterium]